MSRCSSSPVRRPAAGFAGFCLSAALLGVCMPAKANDSDDIQSLHQEIERLKQENQANQEKLKVLEQRLDQAQSTPPAAAPTVTSTAPAAGNALNPAISLILQGTYLNKTRGPDRNGVTGFELPDEFGLQRRGFSLGESELSLAAAIDPYLFGSFTAAVTGDGDVEVEEAYAQTVGLAHGLTLKGGRFFSGIGYENGIHQHAWDFYDAPLVYQVLLGTEAIGNYGDDGVQLRWLAPTDVFLELGAELGRGRSFPATDRNDNGIGAWSLFAHVGDDIGISQSYRAGISWLHTQASQRSFDNPEFFTSATSGSTFSGNSDLFILDGLWKYAPNGDPSRTNLKLQGELFWRLEDGHSSYAGLPTMRDASSTSQGGLYLQAIYQFMPRWRAGVRGDCLFSGHVDYGDNAAYLPRSDYDPRKWSAMLDFSPTEFSRFRLQAELDQTLQNRNDTVILLQYIYSLGAHGAHAF